MFRRITELDLRALDWLQKHCRRPWLDSIIGTLTHLGDLGFVWILWAAALMAEQRRECILLLLAIGLSALCCNGLIKPFVPRSRPSDSQQLIDSERSFPSGHSMASFTSAVLLLILFGGWQGGFALLLALFISFSRLYLGVHHPSDVLAGAVFGSILGLITEPLFGGLAEKLAAWSVLFLGF